MTHTLTIASTWDGQLIPQDQQTIICIDTTNKEYWELDINAPYYGDPAPTEPKGHTDQLWEYEVVELFLLGEESQEKKPYYLELEFSPHGHHLVLELLGIRQKRAEHQEIKYQATIKQDRWKGHAQIPTKWLPKTPLRCNAYAIHGQGTHRKYLAMLPTKGDKPDFHKLDSFERIERFENKSKDKRKDHEADKTI